jgi:hypothetical protein
MSVKVKRHLETVAALKGAAASATEAQAAVQALAAVASDPETTSADLRCRAAELQQELAMNPGDTARREALMQRAGAVAVRYGPSA